MDNGEISIENIKLSFNTLPVDVRTIELDMRYRGAEISIVIPAVHLRDGIDPYYEQAEAFLRAAADEVARYRDDRKAPGYRET